MRQAKSDTQPWVQDNEQCSRTLEAVSRILPHLGSRTYLPAQSTTDTSLTEQDKQEIAALRLTGASLISDIARYELAIPPEWTSREVHRWQDTLEPVVDMFAAAFATCSCENVQFMRNNQGLELLATLKAAEEALKAVGPRRLTMQVVELARTASPVVSQFALERAIQKYVSGFPNILALENFSAWQLPDKHPLAINIQYMQRLLSHGLYLQDQPMGISQVITAVSALAVVMARQLEQRGDPMIPQTPMRVWSHYGIDNLQGLITDLTSAM